MHHVHHIYTVIILIYTIIFHYTIIIQYHC